MSSSLPARSRSATAHNKGHKGPRKQLRGPIAAESVLGTPFTLDQELEPFARWAGRSLWVPPKDKASDLAATMLAATAWPRSSHTPEGRRANWEAALAEHRADFTHVREIEMHKASIRLPKGRLLVAITAQDRFDSITDTVPACVQTRLEEFLDGPGRRPGVKVFYLKPLCIEVGTKLFFTTRESVEAVIDRLQNEAFAEYRRRFLGDLPRRVVDGAADAAFAVPRALVAAYVDRQKRALEAHHAKLEFERRKAALAAATTHRESFRSTCNCDDMLGLMSQLEETEVIRHYARENELSAAEFAQLVQLAAGTLPWFVGFSLASAFVMSIAATVTAKTVVTTSAVAVCDPAFVAELPDAPGVLYKIGHFDEIDGVTHVEI
ncbi:MAG: hypothetical protein ACKOTB_16200 [Planctomycetia bacterium]